MGKVWAKDRMCIDVAAKITNNAFRKLSILLRQRSQGRGRRQKTTIASTLLIIVCFIPRVFGHRWVPFMTREHTDQMWPWCGEYIWGRQTQLASGRRDPGYVSQSAKLMVIPMWHFGSNVLCFVKAEGALISLQQISTTNDLL